MEGSREGAGRLMARTAGAELFDRGGGVVLKLYRAGREHAARVEEENTRAVQDDGAHSARRVLGRVEVDGRAGLLLERLEGGTLRESLARWPLGLGWGARLLAEAQARMHARPGAGLPPLHGELEHYLRAAPLSPALRDPLLRHLDTVGRDERVCHGDLHPGNLFLTADGPRVIDWVAAVRGSPYYDVAATALLLRLGKPPRAPAPGGMVRAFQAALSRAYLRHYFRLCSRPRAPLVAWLGITAARMLAERSHLDRAGLLAAVRRAAAVPVR